MPRLSLYILRQLAGPMALFTFLLTAVIWLSQSMKLLDLIINRGQSAPVFLYLTLLILPQLLVIILPIAFFAGALQGLHRLNAESELVVMSAAGYSRAQLAVPVMAAAAAVMILVYLCNMFLMPLGQRLMKDKVVDIRADIGAAVLNAGEFNTPADGLTVFIHDSTPDGHFRGILVHDSSDAKHPVTYLAKSGFLVQTPAGVRLVLYDGTIEQVSNQGAQLAVLKFKRYPFDLDQFASPPGDRQRHAEERYLPELFWPNLKSDPGRRYAKTYFAEAHNRISEPLYCLAFALIALAAVTRGRRARGAYALRLSVASAAAGAIRILGYGALGLAGRNSIYVAALYLIPLLACLAAILELKGVDLFARLRPLPAPEPEPAQ